MNKVMKRRVLFTISCSLLLFGVNHVNAEEEKEVEYVTVNSIDDVTRAGTYFIRAALDDDNGNALTKLVRIHVKYPKTVLNYNRQEGIDAHDIVVEHGAFKELKDSQIIEIGGAHAWDMDTGVELGITNVEVQEPIGIHGAIHKVLYATDNGTTVEVGVYEKKKISSKVSNTYFNYLSIFSERYSFLIFLLLILTLLPLAIYLLMFFYLQKQNKKVNDFLYKNNTTNDKQDH